MVLTLEKTGGRNVGVGDGRGRITKEMGAEFRANILLIVKVCFGRGSGLSLVNLLFHQFGRP